MQFSHYAVIAPYIKHDLYYLPFVVIISKDTFLAVWLLRALSPHDQFLSTAPPFSLHCFNRIFLVCVCTEYSISILGYNIKYLYTNQFEVIRYFSHVVEAVISIHYCECRWWWCKWCIIHSLHQMLKCFGHIWEWQKPISGCNALMYCCEGIGQ